MDETAPVLVVGLNDGPGAAAALRWAVQEARLHEARIRAVYAYSEPVVADISMVPPDQAQRLEQAQRAAELWCASALEGLAGLFGIPVEVVVQVGPPGPVLVQASENALMLVVGGRRRHALHRLLHGSVGHYCLNHATCPVVAVPVPQR